MSFLYLSRRRAAVSRFRQCLGLLCLACSCGAQPFHAAAAPADYEEEIVALPAKLLKKQPCTVDFHAHAAFVLRKWLFVPVDQNNVLAWLSPTGEGEGRWSMHGLGFPFRPFYIDTIQACPSVEESYCLPETKAIDAALDGSQLWMGGGGTIRDNGPFIPLYWVFHVREKKCIPISVGQISRFDTSWVWVEGNKPGLFLRFFKRAEILADTPFPMIYEPEESDDRLVGVQQGDKVLIRMRWERWGQGNVLLKDNPDKTDEDPPSFCAYRVRVKTDARVKTDDWVDMGDAGLEQSPICVIPGRAEADESLPGWIERQRACGRQGDGGKSLPATSAIDPFSQKPADTPIPPHLRGMILTVVRTVVGGAECLMALAEVDVEGGRELEGHLYINPKPRPERPDQIICLASGLSLQESISLCHLSTAGLFFGLKSQDKVSLFFHQFLFGKRGMDFVIAYYWRHYMGQKVPADLMGVLTAFAPSLCPMGLGKRRVVDLSRDRLISIMQAKGSGLLAQ